MSRKINLLSKKIRIKRLEQLEMKLKGKKKAKNLLVKFLRDLISS